jgi:prepilin-type N-terminal cleavage/methylation domain-containing protein
MMTRTRFFSDDAGFTMIEALIALAIFSIGLLAVGALQANSLKSTGDIAKKTEAWTVVHDEAATLRQMPFYNYPAMTVPAALQNTAGVFPSGNVVTYLNGRYEAHWSVQDENTIPNIDTPQGSLFSGVPAGTYTACKLITVVVTLSGGDPNTAALARVQFLKTWAETGCNYD